MQHKILPVTLLAALACVAGGVSNAFAQQAKQDSETRSADRNRADADRNRADADRNRADAERDAAEQQRQSQRDQQGMERDLEQARRELEHAAREVARLSSEVTGPALDEVTRRLRYVGQRAMLGINIQDSDTGALINAVSPNGPAATAGLAIGDTIVAVDGAALKSSGDGKQSPSTVLMTQMANVDPGEKVVLRVARDGKERDVTVEARAFEPRQLMSMPPMPNLQNVPGLSKRGWNAWFGPNAWSSLQLVTLTPALGAYFGTQKGILVVRGPDNEALGLRDGDVILDIGGREPTSPEHAVRILGSFDSGEKFKVTLMRKQRRETIEVQMPAEDAPG